MPLKNRIAALAVAGLTVAASGAWSKATGGGGPDHLLGQTVTLTETFNGPTQSDGTRIVDGTTEFPTIDGGLLSVSIFDTTIHLIDDIGNQPLDYIFGPILFFAFSNGPAVVAVSVDPQSMCDIAAGHCATYFGNPGSLVLYPTGIFMDLSGSNIAVDQDLIFDVTTLPPVAMVPEPAAWALLMIGVGGIGGALRGRRREVVELEMSKT